MHGAKPGMTPCYFGVAPSATRESVALLGDSHAEHWRAALDVVAQAKHWRVVAITRGGCPLTDTLVRHYPAAAGRGLPEVDRQTPEHG